MFFCKKENKFHFTHYGALIVRIALVFLFYTISRALFFAFNQNFFVTPDDIGKTAYIFRVFFGGMHFDFAALLYVNALFILSAILPFPFRNNRIYKKITTFTFYYLTNIIAFAFDYIDIIYFRFTEKRMTVDVFRFAQAEGGFVNLIPAFLRDYWYIFLIFIVMMTLFVWLSSKVASEKKKNSAFTWIWFVKNLIFAAITAAVVIVGMRGGLQYRPISLSTASKYAKTGNDAFVLNTPFSIIYTVKSTTLFPVRYFDETTLKSIYSPIKSYPADSSFLRKNVIIVILEGFSAEHSKYFNPQAETSYMPHLDEIAAQGNSILCYSNSKRSMEAIPAVVSSLPTLMHNEYLTSNYAGNEISSLPLMLRPYGYKSAFFHGGDNGTLKFDAYSSLAGYHYYYGAVEYNDKKDHDGFWGIYDGPFLQYMLNQLDTISKPFFASVFTLSSHHPYNIPDDYRKTLNDPNQKIEIRESILYADHALGAFMKEAQKRSWYDNTLFVFTADHTSQSFMPPSRLRSYEIPLIYFASNDSVPPFQSSFSQQIDIMPSVLSYLNCTDTMFAFGNSIFDPHTAFAINYNMESYQFITEKNVFVFDGDSVTLFHKRNDEKRKNLLDTEAVPENEYNLMRAFIQTYNNSLIENRLTVKRYGSK